jgi:hypothetical protein
VERLLEGLVPRVERTKEGLSDQRLLRLEVGVERADRQVGLGHDLREADGGDAVLTKEARAASRIRSRVASLCSGAYRIDATCPHFTLITTLPFARPVST